MPSNEDSPVTGQRVQPVRGEHRLRMWIEAGLAAAALILAVVTVFWQDWIEAVFGTDPDHGNGAVEWLIVVALAAAAVILSLLARRDWTVYRRSLALDS